MAFISTTSTLVDKLKREAKTLRKTTGTSLAVALDTVAMQHGYDHWKHVSSCREDTISLKSLPDSLAEYLDRAAKNNPASTESQKAFAHGFVFAMDVKDALELSLASEFAECDDGWYLAARNLWTGLIHHRDDETGATLFEMQSPEDLVETAVEDLHNYRLFRYLGTTTPASLEEAYKQINQISFFPPTHVWLDGKFIDISEVSEIRVDGQVVHSTVQGGIVLSSSGMSAQSNRSSHPLVFEIGKVQSGLYRVGVLSGGVEVTKPSHYSSIEEAIREEAASVPDGFAYFAEVVYGGASSGTLPIPKIVETASQIAEQLVAIVAEMHAR
nr:hypothetical protein [uncultured Rhodoferax sp.]